MCPPTPRPCWFLSQADVSNPFRALDLSLEWTDRVVKEFYNQGDQEREAGITISTFMDR